MRTAKPSKQRPHSNGNDTAANGNNRMRIAEVTDPKTCTNEIAKYDLP